MDLDAKSEDYPQMAHEIARLQRMVGLLQSKEAWLEEALASVQRMRLTLERHYVAKVKAKPWQKEMPARNRDTGGRTLGTTDENPFLNSNDGENVTRYGFDSALSDQEELTSIFWQTPFGTGGQA